MIILYYCSLPITNVCSYLFALNMHNNNYAFFMTTKIHRVYRFVPLVFYLYQRIPPLHPTCLDGKYNNIIKW